MSWMTELSRVYDLIVEKDDPLDESKPLPLYHTQNNAQVTVILDGKGNFLGAKLVDAKDRAARATCMPCTEESSNRAGSVISPYPLCEKFEYVAGDYAKYEEGRNLSEKYDAYQKQLNAWANSIYTTDAIKSIALYVSKGCLLTDLINTAKVFTLDDKGKLVDKLTDFVRWEIEISGHACSEVWKDTELQKLWIQYYDSLGKDKGLCYVTGEQMTMLRMHPAKLRNSGDKAKIISANDTENFTFRGRFEDAAQTCQVSSEVSLKAHNALRYLIAKQGTRVGDGLTVVSWTSSDAKPVPIVVSGEEFLQFTNAEQQISYSSGKEFAAALTKCIHGYYKDISNKNDVLVMMLNAATPGRMSILLYRQLNESDFVNALENWHTRMAWYCSYWRQSVDGGSKGETINTISSPSPKQITMTAFGDHYKPAQYEKTVELLMPCILDGKSIPLGIEQRCFAAASKLGVYDSESVRQTYLNTACSVYKYNHKEEDYKVALETERKTRDYLYGRLLAVADALEKAALKKPYASQDTNSVRDTNAIRYMQRFSRRPASTWKILYEKLTPYKRQIKPALAVWYEKKITEITALFNADEYVSDLPLSGEYLLGFQCQIKDFYKGKNDSEQEEK